MYYSSDERFIVKQMTHTEMRVLMKILDAYIEHMTLAREVDAHRKFTGRINSLLLRIVQCNRVQMYHHETQCTKKLFRGRLYFMVFENW